MWSGKPKEAWAGKGRDERWPSVGRVGGRGNGAVDREARRLYDLHRTFTDMANDERNRRYEEEEDDDEVCGEDNPGFPLWTSAHGFHHYQLTRLRPWKAFWVLLVGACVVGLVACVAWYFYYVFSTSVFSRIVMENPSSLEWPTTVVCEKQAFRRAKITGIQSFTTQQASLLTWSLGGRLALPEVYDTDSRIDGLINSLDAVLERAQFNGSHDLLAEAAAPTCQEFILECRLGNDLLNSSECCGRFFNPKPVMCQYGACFTTSGASEKFVVKGAGESFGLQVITVHEDANVFDSNLASEDILGTSGVNFAVVDAHTSAVTALRTRGGSAQIGSVVSVGITRTTVDNRDLEFSAIGRMSCVTPGDTESDDDEVEADFLVGLDLGGQGYTRDNCATAKDEILARELVNCTFTTSSADNSFDRCSPVQSATYYRSFIDSDNSALDKVPVVSRTSSVDESLEKDCPQDCIQDRYAATVTTAELSNELKQELSDKITGSGTQNINVVVMKFFLNSLEYQRIHNFPQHGLSFLAEVGGLMAFFLGISVISLFECLCYCCHCCRHNCCSCCDGDDEEGEDIEELPPPKWNKGRNKERAYQRDSRGGGSGDSAAGRRSRPDLSRFESRY